MWTVSQHSLSAALSYTHAEPGGGVRGSSTVPLRCGHAHPPSSKGSGYVSYFLPCHNMISRSASMWHHWLAARSGSGLYSEPRQTKNLNSFRTSSFTMNWREGGLGSPGLPGPQSMFSMFLHSNTCQSNDGIMMMLCQKNQSVSSGVLTLCWNEILEDQDHPDLDLSEGQRIRV